MSHVIRYQLHVGNHYPAICRVEITDRLGSKTASCSKVFYFGAGVDQPPTTSHNFIPGSYRRAYHPMEAQKICDWLNDRATGYRMGHP